MITAVGSGISSEIDYGDAASFAPARCSNPDNKTDALAGTSCFLSDLLERRRYATARRRSASPSARRRAATSSGRA